jgi:hypothetical protein
MRRIQPDRAPLFETNEVSAEDEQEKELHHLTREIVKAVVQIAGRNHKIVIVYEALCRATEALSEAGEGVVEKTGVTIDEWLAQCRPFQRHTVFQSERSRDVRRP